MTRWRFSGIVAPALAVAAGLAACSEGEREMGGSPATAPAAADAAGMPGPDASAAADAITVFVRSRERIASARCRCEPCASDEVAPACLEEALTGAGSGSAAGLEAALACRADWLTTVSRCLEAASCDGAELATCARPLTGLELLCDPWPEELAAELRACDPAAVAACALSDGGCGDGARARPPETLPFGCADGGEIPGVFRCDFAEQCEDGSDEVGCDGIVFTCGDGTAVPADWRCDLQPDCADGSDERDCGPIFSCPEGAELPAAWLCDGVDDCPSGADEASCP